MNIVGSVVRIAHSCNLKGWRYCDGQVLSIDKYPELFSVLYNDYGGDGKITFALPDLRPRDNDGNLLNLNYGDKYNGVFYIPYQICVEGVVGTY